MSLSGAAAVQFANDPNTVRVEARFKNARLLNAINAASVPMHFDKRRLAVRESNGKVASFCKFYSLPYGLVCGLLRLQLSPMVHPFGRARVRPVCLQLASILDSSVEFLFPADLYAIQWPKRLAIEVSHDKFRSLRSAPIKAIALPPNQEANLETQALRQSIDSVLKTLTPREEKVIRMRFGIGDDASESSLDDVGKAFAVSKERIRQIEKKALRKLRHPSRSKRLQAFAPGAVVLNDNSSLSEWHDQSRCEYNDHQLGRCASEKTATRWSPFCAFHDQEILRSQAKPEPHAQDVGVRKPKCIRRPLVGPIDLTNQIVAIVAPDQLLMVPTFRSRDVPLTLNLDQSNVIGTARVHPNLEHGFVLADLRIEKGLDELASGEHWPTIFVRARGNKDAVIVGVSLCNGRHENDEIQALKLWVES